MAEWTNKIAGTTNIAFCSGMEKDDALELNLDPSDVAESSKHSWVWTCDDVIALLVKKLNKRLKIEATSPASRAIY